MLHDVIAKGIASLQGNVDPAEKASIALAESSLYEFARQAWEYADPTSTFEESKTLEAMCLHLQAVTEGKIRILVANMPPGFAKSISLVMWKAWEFIRHPKMTWLNLTYSDDFAQRDSNRTRDLIKSEWYQRRWGHIVKVREDRDAARKFFLESGGNSFATSTQGGGTGARAGRIVCFPPDELLWTVDGPRRFKDVVENKLKADVWSYDRETGLIGRKPLVGWHVNPGSEILEVVLTDGSSFRCTPDHLVITGRGDVSADSLLPSDVLPNPLFLDGVDGLTTHIESLCQNSVWFRRSHDFADIGFREFSIAARLAAPSSATGVVAAPSYIRPISSTPDLMNSGRTNAEFLCKFFGGLCAAGNSDGLFGSQDGSGPSVVKRKRSMRFGVGDILGPSAISNVLDMIVGRIAVEMPDFHMLGYRANEGESNHTVDEEVSYDTFLADVEAGITASQRSLDNSLLTRQRMSVPSHDLACLATNPAVAGHAVERFETSNRHRSPLFIRHVGYSEKTYCVTVADYHTVLVGDVKSIPIATKQCDDLNKLEHAYAKIEKEKVSKIFDSLIFGRTSDPRKRSIVIVQQRLASDDITGHLLGTDDNEDGQELRRRVRGLVHLRLPLEYDPRTHCKTPIWEDWRTEEGESLWPERYGPREIEEWKATLGPMGTASQLQQNPLDLKGAGLFGENFRYFTSVHEENEGEVFVLENAKKVPARMCFWFQVVDTAIKEGRENDKTAVGTFALTPDHELLIVDMDAARVPVPKQYDWILDKRDKHPLVLWQAIEARASGAGLIQEGIIKGHPFREIGPELYQMEEMQRVQELSVRYENGMVYHRKNQPWTLRIEGQLYSFPAGKNDEMTTMMYAALLVKRERMFKLGTGASVVGVDAERTTIHQKLADRRDSGESLAAERGLFGMRGTDPFEESRGRRMFGR